MSHRTVRAWPVLSILFLALVEGLGCGNASKVPSPPLPAILEARGIVIAELFAQPTDAEREAVLADWHRRDTSARDVRIEAHFELPDARVMLIASHAAREGRHFGAILAPKAALTTQAHVPILLNLHGLGPEHTITVPDPAAGSERSPPTELVTIWPAFGGETLRFRDGEWKSDGDPWDLCDGASDKALALLASAETLLPGADPTRVVAFGGSRGGTVALLVSLRDERIRRVVSLAGPTDFFDTQLLEHENAFILYERWFLEPLLNHTGDVADVRTRLLQCSPSYFAEDLPPVQIHHGTADRNLPVEQSMRLERRLRQLGRMDYEAYYYEDGDHQLAAHQGEVRARVVAWAAPLFASE